MPKTTESAVTTNPIVKASSNDEGNIDLKPDTRWALLFVGMDFIQEPLRVTIEADGFQTLSLETNFTESPSSNRYIQLGTIRLHRIGASQPVAKGGVALDMMTSETRIKL